MSEREYVPHAVTGEPVPVLTPEEQAAQKAERERNPAVHIDACRCWCGATAAADFWMWSGDGFVIDCALGHRNQIRFLPETVS